jgi:hypothetical protein
MRVIFFPPEAPAAAEPPDEDAVDAPDELDPHAASTSTPTVTADAPMSRVVFTVTPFS